MSKTITPEYIREIAGRQYERTFTGPIGWPEMHQQYLDFINGGDELKDYYPQWSIFHMKRLIEEIILLFRLNSISILTEIHGGNLIERLKWRTHITTFNGEDIEHWVLSTSSSSGWNETLMFPSDEVGWQIGRESPDLRRKAWPLGKNYNNLCLNGRNTIEVVTTILKGEDINHKWK